MYGLVKVFLVFKKLKTYSCVNQLLTITPEIFSSFNDNCEVRGIFVDMK